MSDIKVGDEVSILSVDGVYKNYESFFKHHRIQKNFWEKGLMPDLDDTFIVQFVGKHTTSLNSTLAVCKSKHRELEYLCDLDYLKKVNLTDNSFQKNCENPKNDSKNKYMREIKKGVFVDVYDVLMAFKTECPAIDHAIKKLLCSGSRGVKSSIQDKQEAIQSIQRSIELEQEKV